MPLKILHCADLHLGYETHGRLDPATGLNTRLLDFRRSFDVLVDRAVADDVDLFLFAGDAYRTADPTPTQQRQFAEALRPVLDAGIPVAMVVGNHDHPVSFGKASSVDIFGVLDGAVDVFAQPTFRAEGEPGGPIQTKAGPLQLVALPWPIRSKILARDEYRGKTPHEIRETIESYYTAFVQQCAAEADPAVPLVVCAHLTVQGSELSGSERASLIAHEPTFTVAQLAQPGVDYVALGHIHRFQDRNAQAHAAGEGPPVVYSSSIERISFKEHDAEKGFVLVDIDPAGAPGRRTTFEFVPTPARRFVPIAVDATEAPDPTAAVLAEIARHDIADAVVRVRYRVGEEQPAVDEAAVRAALADADTIAAVERELDAVERRQRTVVRTDTSLKEAVERYVDQHETLAKLKDDLVAAALEIEREVDAAGA
ncbi:metallophosphoesterase family protein [Rubrivirga sp.]|uniref:metallophosphoesterase family protein n=1 Tax=Rubrivirga sp. TaxID=1885344 RepID=UPI003B51BD81